MASQTCVTIPNDGNVYQGLYRAREGLEKAINDLLASHGIVAAEEPPAISGESLAADTEPPPAFDPEATQP
jgi:hypothetical protein